MNRSIALVDSLAVNDLQVLLARASKVEEGSVRIISGGGVLAVYVAVLYPTGLLDETPTVLGLRTFAVDDREPLDVVVPVMSLLQRVERGLADSEGGSQKAVVTLPHEVNTVTWAGISPPRGGWAAQQPVDAQLLASCAERGMAEVASTLPTGSGTQIVQKVRSEVWTRPIEGLEHIPSGAAFAAQVLGFLGEDPVAVYESGPWTRLTTDRGHVLIKRRAWSLAR